MPETYNTRRRQSTPSSAPIYADRIGDETAIIGVIGEDMYTSVDKQPFTYGSLDGDPVAVVSLARLIADGQPELVRQRGVGIVA